jgi:VWFA-related protein
MGLLSKPSCLLLLAMLSMVAVSTQSQQANPTPTPGSPQQGSAVQPETDKTIYESATVLKATTRLVVVDVVATDRKGEAIRDLERPDFAILEDGKEQQIRVFSFQQPKTSSPAPLASAALKIPEGAFTNAPQYQATSALNVVLLDALNTTLPHQAYVREQMIKFLEKLPKERPVAVYSLSSKLTLLQDFSSDPEVLKDVVKKLQNKTSPVLDNPAGGEDAQILPTGAADSGMVSDQMLQSIMRFEQERVAFQTDIRVTSTLNALNAIARSLAGYPGRKNLVWISEAFPLSIDPNTELTGDVFAGTRNYGPQIAATADALMDAQVAVYPVDAAGLVTSSVFSASNSGVDKFGRGMGRNPTRMATAISNESAARQSVQATMQDMAQRTGGKAFYNRNDIDHAIGSSIEDGSVYYTLAYYPDNKDWNGKFRKIQVKVNRDGIKLRYRLGYYAVDPKVFAEQNKKQQAVFFSDALNPDSPAATGLIFHAGVVQPSEKTQDRVLVNFGIDPNAISFATQSDGTHHARVECVVQAYTPKGDLIKTEGSTITAALKPETYARVMQTNTFPCQQHVSLPAGVYKLRLGVRDDNTGLLGTASARVTVIASPQAAPADPSDKTSSTKSDDKKP